MCIFLLVKNMYLKNDNMGPSALIQNLFYFPLAFSILVDICSNAVGPL